MKRHSHLQVLLVSCTVLLTGCNTTDISSARVPYEQGMFAVAADEISAIHPQDEDGASTDNRACDNIWLLLEKGKMLMDAGRFAESNVAFYEANRILETLDEEATVSLGAVRSGAAALAFDDCQSDYVGMTYDRILLPAYVAVNHLMLGEPQEAAVAARQQLSWQAIAEVARAKDIERIKELDEEAKKNSLGFTSTGASAFMDSKFELRNNKESDDMSPSQTIQSIQASAREWSKPALNDYGIPFGHFVGAIALSAAGKAGEADNMLRGLRGMVPSCDPLRVPLMQPKTAYVIFENGLAPKRTDETVKFVYTYTAEVDVRDANGKPTGQKKEIQVPSLVVLPFVGLKAGVTTIEGAEDETILAESFPADSLRIMAGTSTVESAMLHDFTGTVGLEFKDALPGTIARIIIRAAIQEAVQIAVNSEAGIFGVLAGAIAKSTIDPDLRSWESLGANHQVAVVPVPNDGLLKLSTMHSGEFVATQEVSVPVGPPVFVYVRSTNAGNLVAHSCQLVSSYQLASN